MAILPDLEGQEQSMLAPDRDLADPSDRGLPLPLLKRHAEGGVGTRLPSQLVVSPESCQEDLALCQYGRQISPSTQHRGLEACSSEQILYLGYVQMAHLGHW